jgi:hypothetical protein
MPASPSLRFPCSMHPRFALPPPWLADCSFFCRPGICPPCGRGDNSAPGVRRPHSRIPHTPEHGKRERFPDQGQLKQRAQKAQTRPRLRTARAPEHGNTKREAASPNHGNFDALLGERGLLGQAFHDGRPSMHNTSQIEDPLHTQMWKHRTGRCLLNHGNLNSLSTSALQSPADY